MKMTKNRPIRHVKQVLKRLSAFAAACLLWCAYIVPVAAADSLLTPVNQPPVEMIAAQNGNWEVQYWGNEGRYAYRFLGAEDGRFGVQPEDAPFAFEVDTTMQLRTLVMVHQNTLGANIPTMEDVVKNGASLVNATPLGPVGSVSVIAEDGTSYGPFPCVTDGAPIINGVEQDTLLWVADCGEQVLAPGRYTVQDSSPESQLVVAQQPVMLAKVVDDAAWQEYLASSGTDRNYQGRYEAAVFNQDGEPVAGPFVLAVADSGNQLEIACHLADFPFTMKLDKTNGEDSLEAKATISVLPDQGLGALSLSLVFNRVKGEWLLSGNGAITLTQEGEQQTIDWKIIGNMTGKELPSFYFPMPVAGMGGIGAIPGPGSNAQAVVGVIAPGLIGLLATLLAGNKPGGGSPVAELPIPAAPDIPNMPAAPSVPDLKPAAPPIPEPSIEPPVIEPTAPTDIPPVVNEPPVGNTPAIPETLPDSTTPQNPLERLFPDKPIEPAEPKLPFDRLFPDAPPPEPQPEPFMGFWKRSVTPEAGTPETEGSRDLLKLLEEKAAKRQMLSKLEGLLRTKEASASGEAVTGFAAIREKILGLSEDVRFSRKSPEQIQTEVGALQQTMSPTGDSNLSNVISKAVAQAADVSGASDMSDVGRQIANDVASGGLSEVGFIGDDLVVTAVMGVETSDVLSEVASTMRVHYAENVAEKLKEQGIEVLGGMFKPRTDLPEKLLDTLKNGQRRL